MYLELRFWRLASPRLLGTTTMTGLNCVTLSTLPLLLRSSEALRFSSVLPRKPARPSFLPLFFFLRCCACRKSSPRRESTIAGAIFSSSALSSPERPLLTRAVQRHGRQKRLAASAAFFSESAQLPLPSNRRSIFTPPPILFRSGCRQAVASFQSPQSYQLERNRRNLRHCRNRVDSR